MTSTNHSSFPRNPNPLDQYSKCPGLTRKLIDRAHTNLDRYRTENPQRPIDEEAIILALDVTEPYFITSNLYWECECQPDFVRPRDMLSCEECGQMREDAPDARIADIKAQGIHIDWTDPDVIGTLDEHNTNWRTTPTIQQK